MIYIGNIRDVHPGEFDETHAIVRSYKGQSDWIIHTPELSPSWDLFSKFQELKKAGNWNQDAFVKIYTPQFLTEMQSEQAEKKLNELYYKDRDGKRIALVCFCPNEDMCHRSIIAGMLQGAGANVSLKTPVDRSYYYDLYRYYRAMR